MTTPANEPPARERLPAASDARLSAARSDRHEVIVLIEPDPVEADRIYADLARRGVRSLTFTNPWRGVAHAGAESSAVIVASARLGTEPLREVVNAVKNETKLPVLIAFHPEEDTATIGPAVLAGGRPLITLPYEARDMVRVVAEALTSLPTPVCVTFGRLSIVPERHHAHLDGKSLALSTIEFKVLAELIRRGGRATSRQALLSAGWAKPPADPKGSLAAALKRLRRKMEAAGIPEAVETVRGVGYRLNARALVEDESTRRP